MSGSMEVSPSVAKVLTEKVAEGLQGAIDSDLRKLGPLPEGFKIVFHNTEEALFTFGGWLPSRVASQTTTATLVYDLDIFAKRGREDNVIKDLCTRQKGRFFMESPQDFVSRARENAWEQLDELRYLRHFQHESRVRRVCDVISDLLRQANISGSTAAISRSLFNERADVPVLFVDSEEVDTVTGLVTHKFCQEGFALPSLVERGVFEEMEAQRRIREYNNRPPAQEEIQRCSKRGAVCFFDDIPVLILPAKEKVNFDLLSRSYTSCYRFTPDPALFEALADTLKGEKFNVMKKKGQP